MNSTSPTTTITISEALKGALEHVREEMELGSLDATVNWVIENPQDWGLELRGDELTLTEPIKVQRGTQQRVKSLKEMGTYQDYDAVLRAKIGAPDRVTPGERPVDVRPLS